jgi:hypothetical protein
MRMKLRIVGLLVAPVALVIVTAALTGWSDRSEFRVMAEASTNTTVEAAPSWHVHRISTADLEGPPVVVPGTEEAFALHGNDGEELATEPLERVNLVSGDLDVGPRVPDDALLTVVGSNIVLVAPANYSASGVVTRPWSLWTVNQVTLRPERPVGLPFVSNFGVVVPSAQDPPAASDLWISDGAALWLVDLASGTVRRTVRIPGLDLSVDPSGRHLYVLTGSGGSTTSGPKYRAGTIVELDGRTGSIVASSMQWTSSPRLRIAASAEGVYLIDAARPHRSVVFLDARNLRPAVLPAALESDLARSLGSEDEVTAAAVDHSEVFGSPGRLTCAASGAPSLAGTALTPKGDSWAVFGQRGATLFAWDISSATGSSRIESIAAPSRC